MSLQSLLPALSERPKTRIPKLQELTGGLQADFNLSTSFLVGASIQVLLVLILPKKYALTPAIFLLTIHIIDVILITKGYKANPYFKNVVWKKTTAQILDQNGALERPGQEKVAVLILGSKSNHPLGIFSPDYKTVNEFFKRMTDQLDDPMSQESGFLGMTKFVRKDANGATENMSISYWRSIEHVHAYAHGPVHTEAWRWWDKTLSAHKHIGFMHEVFEAPKSMWEGIYINFQPTLMGATTFLKRKDANKTEAGKVSDEWVSGLLDANRGRLRTSNGRRGLTGDDADRDKFGKNYYTQ